MKDIQLFADDINEEAIKNQIIECLRAIEILKSKKSFSNTYFSSKIKDANKKLQALIAKADSAEIGGFPDEDELSFSKVDEDEF